MADTTGEMVLKLSAEISGLRAQLNAAQGEVKNFRDKAGSTMGDLAKAAGELFTADKMFAFIKDGVMDLANFERSVDNLTNKIKGAGQGFDGMRESVTDYAQSVQAATRFSDDQVIGSLDKLMQRTQDLNASYKVNEAAMNFAVFANTDLADASNILGLAYEGNERGLMQVSRALGITGQNAKNADFIFAELEKRTSGLARSENNLATNMDKAQHQIDDAAKTLGGELAPAVTIIAGWFAEGLPGAIKKCIAAWQWLALAVEYIPVMLLTVVVTGFTKTAEVVAAFGMLLVNIWKHPIDATETFFKSVKESTISGLADIKNMSKGYGDTMGQTWDEIWKAHEKAKIKTHASDLQAHLTNKTLEKSEAEYFAEMNDVKTRSSLSFFTGLSTAHTEVLRVKGESEDAYNARYKAGMEANQAVAKNMYDSMVSVANTATDATSTAFEKWGASGARTAGRLVGLMKDAATAILRSFLMSMGKEMFMRGLMSLIQAAAYALGIVTLELAPGWFGKAALEIGEGAAMMALASTVKLAQGGIVTRPTNAMIGEDGPEAVIPLGKGMNQFGAVSVHGVSMNFPNVRKQSDIKGAEFGRSVAMQTAKAFASYRQRTGQK